MHTDQKSNAYLAEWLYTDLLDTPSDLIDFMGSTIPRPVEIRFSERLHAQQYADRVLSHPIVRERYGKRTVTVRVSNRMIKKAYARDHIITLPNRERAGWAWRESVLLHELAHTLAPSGHGPRWAGTFVHLTEVAMGSTAAWMLSALFDQQGVTIERSNAA